MRITDRVGIALGPEFSLERLLGPSSGRYRLSTLVAENDRAAWNKNEPPDYLKDYLSKGGTAEEERLQLGNPPPPSQVSTAISNPHAPKREIPEHDACGEALIIDKSGQGSAEITKKGLEALRRMVHRGAIGADGLSSDGVGLLVDLPVQLFREYLAKQLRGTDGEIENIDNGQPPYETENPLAVAQVFLPRVLGNVELTAEYQREIKEIFEAKLTAASIKALVWRDVPVDTSVVGEIAEELRPDIGQLIIENDTGLSAKKFDQKLHKISLEIERDVLARLKEKEQHNQEAARAAADAFHICSMSSRTIVYKGMVLVDNLDRFYPDLSHNIEYFISKASLVHTRFSTNSRSKWRSAQPFNLMAHNGEFNTIKKVDMVWRERFKNFLGYDPVPVATSDSGRVNMGLGYFIHQMGYSPAKALLAIMPPAITPGFNPLYAKLISTLNVFQEPASGPANVYYYDGETAIAHNDNLGLRPSRKYGDNQIEVFSSEVGTVDINLGQKATRLWQRIKQEAQARYDHIGPGAIHMFVFGKPDKAPHEYNNEQVFKAVVEETKVEMELFSQVQAFDPAEAEYSDILDGRSPSEILKLQNALIRKVNAVGLSIEDTNDLQEMAKKGATPTKSMGNTAPIYALRQKYTSVTHAARQLFAQITNPPIDYLREGAAFSVRQILGTRDYANKDFVPTDLVTIEQPVFFQHEFDALKNRIGADKFETIDCTIYIANEGLEAGLDRIREKARRAIQEGVTHLILTDEKLDAAHAALPSMDSVSAIYSMLMREGLSDKITLHAKFADLTNEHSVAMALTCGASTIQPYLSEAWLQLEDTQHIKTPSTTQTRQATLESYRKALNDGIVRTMAKMGVTDLQSYRGGYYFSVTGRDRAFTEKYYLKVSNKASGVTAAYTTQLMKECHEDAFRDDGTDPQLNLGGLLHVLQGEESHNFNKHIVDGIQAAANAANFHDALKAYHEHLVPAAAARGSINLRDIVEVKSGTEDAIAIDQVQTLDELMDRVYQGAMSLGALSPEGQIANTLSALMGGYHSNTGEGGLIDVAELDFILFPTAEKGLRQQPEMFNGEFLKDQTRARAFITTVIKQLIILDTTGEKEKAKLDKKIEEACKAVPQNITAEYLKEFGWEDKYLRVLKSKFDYLSDERVPRLLVEKTLGLLGLDDKIKIPESINQKFLDAIQWKNMLMLASVQDVKQLSTAHFGVTTPYLADSPIKHFRLSECPNYIRDYIPTWEPKGAPPAWFTEVVRPQRPYQVEIKYGQGFKPGEGGEMPGNKINETIANARGTTPGQRQPSPACHYDEFSIEDFRIQVCDLLAINPNVRITIKLVACEGIGTVALGLAKTAKELGLSRDQFAINIAGQDGGSGAGKRDSKLSTGDILENGLCEVHQTLLAEGYRDGLRLRASGALITGDDFFKVFAAGADEIEQGTATMVAGGCDNIGTCHENNCPTGWATQDRLMRLNFDGKAGQDTNYKKSAMEHTRELMAQRGITNVSELVGSGAQHLQKKSDAGAVIANCGLDIENTIFRKVTSRKTAANDNFVPYRDVDKDLIDQVARRQEHMEKSKVLQLARVVSGKLKSTKAAILSTTIDAYVQKRETLRLDVKVDNTRLGLGGGLAGYLQREKDKGNTTPNVEIHAHGQAAGQSAGLALIEGMKLVLHCVANDGLGKIQSGGSIVVAPKGLVANITQYIVGNFAHLGSRQGKQFINGAGGERTGVLLHGGSMICDGAGQHFGEYVTGGYPGRDNVAGPSRVINLGDLGGNAFTGMTGGYGFQYDPDGSKALNWEQHFNPESVFICNSRNETISDAKKGKTLINCEQEIENIKELLFEYYAETKNKKAGYILKNWKTEKHKFLVAVPKAYDARHRSLQMQKTALRIAA